MQHQACVKAAGNVTAAPGRHTVPAGSGDLSPSPLASLRWPVSSIPGNWEQPWFGFKCQRVSTRDPKCSKLSPSAPCHPTEPHWASHGLPACCPGTPRTICLCVRGRLCQAQRHSDGDGLVQAQEQMHSHGQAPAPGPLSLAKMVKMAKRKNTACQVSAIKLPCQRAAHPALWDV